MIHREAIQFGPPILEWALIKILRKKVIYDFDDAIWQTDKLDESLLIRVFKWRRKVGQICQWSYKVSVGNEYLASFVRQYNSNVVVNPTTIDTKHLHDPSKYPRQEMQKDIITIGWTGSYSTLKYLKEIESVLQEIEKRFSNIEFLVIADQVPDLALQNLVCLKWSKDSEIQDLLKIDIGIMPLPDDPWTRGKCGFKVLQYMALEIPPIASPVGVNSEIIQHGVNGFLCSTSEEWIGTLTDLINSIELRKRIGKTGRQSVVDNYSVESNTSNFLSLFE